MTSQNYFALDLELNNLKNGKTPKIIQVGIAVGSGLEDITTYSWYLNPEEPISEEITKLTGITDEMVQTLSVSHQTLATELGELLKANNVFCNPICWGQGDADELKAEFRERNIDFPFFGRRIFDVKTIYVFNQIVNNRTKAGGLRKSMASYGLDFIGTPHRADWDALNTLRFFFHLVNRQSVFENYAQTMRNFK